MRRRRRRFRVTDDAVDGAVAGDKPLRLFAFFGRKLTRRLAAEGEMFAASVGDQVSSPSGSLERLEGISQFFLSADASDKSSKLSPLTSTDYFPRLLALAGSRRHLLMSE